MTNEILDSNCEWICPYNYDCGNCPTVSKNCKK